MGHGNAGPPARAAVPQACSEVEGRAVEVGGGDGVVAALVVVVAVGQVDLAALEFLVEHPALQCDGELAAPFAQFESQLGREVQRRIQADAFLLHHQARAPALVQQFERHVGRQHERARRVVDAHPLQASGTADFQKVGLADGRGIVERRHFVVLAHLRVGLGRCRAVGGRNQHDGRQISEKSGHGLFKIEGEDNHFRRRTRQRLGEFQPPGVVGQVGTVALQHVAQPQAELDFGYQFEVR